jgi:hypothetical protein
MNEEKLQEYEHKETSNSMKTQPNHLKTEQNQEVVNQLNKFPKVQTRMIWGNNEVHHTRG